MTDGTREYNDRNYRVSMFYDLAKTAIRLAFAQASSSRLATAVALTPGWLRSEMMLENFGVTKANWRDAAAVQPHFAAISEARCSSAVRSRRSLPTWLHQRNGVVLVRRTHASTASPTSTDRNRLLAVHGQCKISVCPPTRPGIA